MKKLVSLLLALLLVLGLMPAVLAQDVIELDMYFPVAVGGGPDALINTLCEEFHAEYPTIKINPVYAGSYADTRTKVIAAIQANNTPAIALMFSIDLYQLFSMGVLYDYNSFCTTDVDKAWLEGFYPGFMENSRLPQADGSYLTYGIPWQRSTIIMYYTRTPSKRQAWIPRRPPRPGRSLRNTAKSLSSRRMAPPAAMAFRYPLTRQAMPTGCFRPSPSPKGGRT